MKTPIHYSPKENRNPFKAWCGTNKPIMFAFYWPGQETESEADTVFGGGVVTCEKCLAKKAAIESRKNRN